MSKLIIRPIAIEKMRISRNLSKDKPKFLAGILAVAVILTLIYSFSLAEIKPTNGGDQIADVATVDDDTQLQAILHYATSRIVPQQTLAEISVSSAVLRSLGPCRFLVFGLGYDSLMWTSLNPRGTTLFLEEDPRWVHSILRKFPTLRARIVRYATRLRQADTLLSSYKREPSCYFPEARGLRGNTRCKLALSGLPDEVYDEEWDAIMIDAPRGYFPEAPGRMAAIYTAAVMARGRKGDATHVFLHDVNRRVEKMYAEEFLCRKYLVKTVGRLWHFLIPSSSSSSPNSSSAFCPPPT
ncbi:Probable methyltransferase At1g27930 [Linum grandiflorum]